MQMHVGKHPYKFIIYQATRKFSAFSTHAYNSFIFHKFPLFHNFVLFCSYNMVFINHMLQLKYPLTVIVHSHLLHYDGKICFAVYCIMLLQKCVPDAYCGKPVCMYLQQIDHLIGNIKTAFGVQFLIMWGAFHCMRDH